MFCVRENSTGCETPPPHLIPSVPTTEKIGIPDDDAFEGDEPYLPSWEVPLSEYFGTPGDRANYDYDFGDGWEHEIILEAITPRLPNAKYPMCLDGARACPPEDCGGAPGYEEMLKVLQDPSHQEYESMVQWVGCRYDPDLFDHKRVRFDSPRKRFRIAFEGKEQ